MPFCFPNPRLIGLISVVNFMARRVVITGMGAVTPLGNDVPTFWQGLVNGKSGIARIQAFDVSGYDCQIAGEVKNFEPAKWWKNPKDARRADRYNQLAMAASKEAYAHAKVADPSIDLERAGAIVGSGIGGLISLTDQFAIYHTKGPNRISPCMIPTM